MKKIFFYALSFVFVFALGGVKLATAAPLSNGSFEDGNDPGSFSTVSSGGTDINNWNVDRGNIDYIGSYWQAKDGKRSIDMNGLEPGTLSQTFETILGAVYKVTFYLSGNPDSRPEDDSLYSPAEKKLRVSATGAIDEDFTYTTGNNSLTDMQWEEKTYTFTATNSETTLTFASQIEGAFGPALDNVTVTMIDNDTDKDGITNAMDYCPQTGADTWTASQLGVNRLMWNGSKWMTKNPKGKVVDDASVQMSYTHGCSCRQILDELKDEFGWQMEGHRKFGCSKSVLEDWNADWSDGVLDGKKYLETVVVDSANINGASSIGALATGKKYLFGVSGTWNNRGWEWVDAKYTDDSSWGSPTDAPDGGYDPKLLDLQVNASFVDWGVYSASHEYSMMYTPTSSSAVNFRVFDGDVATNTQNPGWFGDNVGSLTVKIYQMLW